MEISKSKIIDILESLNQAASFDQIIAEYKQRHGIDIEGDCYQFFLLRLSKRERKVVNRLTFDAWFGDYLLSIPGIELDIVDDVCYVKFIGFVCELCDTEYGTEYDFEQHNKTNQHIEKMMIAYNNREAGEGEYDCKVCSVKCDDKAALMKHEQGSEHKKKYSALFTGKFDCRVCCIKFQDMNNFLNHIDGKKHKKKVDAIDMNPDALYEPSHQLEEELVAMVRDYGKLELDLVMQLYTSRFERRLRKSLKELVKYMSRLDIEACEEEERLVLSNAEKEKVTAALFSKKKSKKKYKMKTINNDA